MLPTTVNGTQHRPSQAKPTTGKDAAKDAAKEDCVCVNNCMYDSSDHWEVLTKIQLGSIWPKVIWYCIANVVNTVFVVMLKRYCDIDLSFSDRGHTFMSMMVSFLMVTRSNIAYSRYMEARMDLSNAMTACRELVSYAVAFTRYKEPKKGEDEREDRSNKWRFDLAMRTIKLLTAVVSVLEYQNTGKDAWKNPAISIEETNALKRAVRNSNERTPLVLAMWVQSTIASNVEFLPYKLHANKELKLYSLLSDFVKSYHGLMKLVSTPFPFPLVQMTRTFLFIWIFTLPWVLVNDLEKPPALIFTVFFITYAFIGLEFVAIELDDPFGDDDIDFAVKKLALATFQDIYIVIYDADRKDDADKIDYSKLLHEFIEALKQKDEEDEKSVPTTPMHIRHDSLKAMENCITVKSNDAGTDKSRWILDERKKKQPDPESGSVHPFKTQHNSSNYGSFGNG